MKAFVDKELCIGCGVCEVECPEVFRIADDGLAEAMEGELLEEVQESAQEAREQCPVEAIIIE